MRHLTKYFLWIGCLVLGFQSAWAFSLLGPVANGGDAWQTTAIGYNPLPASDSALGIEDPALIGPKNLGEGYRRNTPFMYYAFDPTFGDYFGSNGEYAVQQAFDLVNGVMNGQGNTPLFIVNTNYGILADANGGPAIELSATNSLDSYSANLSEFPLNSQSENYQAYALGLYDVKSWTLTLLMEQLGLADSVRYAWCLHDRYQRPNTTCPNGMEYLVIQRNYGLVPSALNEVQYSPYINDELYNYTIKELCDTPNEVPPNAAVRPLPADPLTHNGPVASGNGMDLLEPGFFYIGLTRDDVGGLRFLYSTNNWDTPSPQYRESPAAGSALKSYGTPQLLYTSNYNALVAASMTNDPATLQALYPGIQFNYVTNYFSNVVSQTLTYVTNYPIGGVAGQGYVGLQTTYTTNIVDFYKYTFGGNLVVNSNYPTTTYRYQTITIGPPIGSPVGTPFVTNVTYSQPFQSNIESGDYFVITNGGCPPTFLETLQTNVTIVTNTLVTTTNAVTTTTNGTSIVQNLVSYFTNYVFAVKYCNLVANAPADYQGIGRMQFIRTREDNYDYLSGQFITPITNDYSMVMITNGQYVIQHFQRVLTSPDFLFQASDQVSGPQAIPVIQSLARDAGTHFNQANIQPLLAGPGTIDTGTPVTISFDKVGPIYENMSQYFLNGPANAGPLILWGSFDGTTNAPIVYPNGTSLQNLANMATSGMHMLPPVLPEGTNGVPYSATLTAGGGLAPYSWSLAPISDGLPSGLTLTTSDSGMMISGIPTQSGTFDNIVFQVSDSETPPRTVQVGYSLTIH